MPETLPTQNTDNTRRIPWVRHGILGAASFMTALDRTRSIKGGLGGLALAASFIGLRHLLTPRQDSEFSGLGYQIWQAVEFSAITSLLGSSMMKGGFLHKAVGKPRQRAAATTGYSKLMSGAKNVPFIGGTKSVHEVLRKFRGYERSAANFIQEMASKRAVESSSMMKVIYGLGARGGESFHRLTRRYSGIAEQYLMGVARGPRGPFEITSGLFDVSKRLIDIVEKPQAEIRGALQALLGPKFNKLSGPIVWGGSKTSVGKEFLGNIANVKNTMYYKGATGVTKYRKYFEGIFGSPTVGEAVHKYGSIKNIPIGEYVSGNIKDVFYGAAPGIALMSPFIAWEGAKIGTGKAYEKITGHHPGWANKETETEIDSDFTAGSSWTHIKDALTLMGVKTGYGKKSIQRGLVSWSKLSSEQIIENLKKSGVKVVKTREKYLSGRAGKTFLGRPKIEYNPLGFRIMGKQIGQSQAQYGKQTLAHEVLEIVSQDQRFINIAGKKHYFRRVVPGGMGGSSARALAWSHKDIGVITGEIRFSEAAGIPYKAMGGLRKSLIKTEGILPRHERFARRYKRILEIGIEGKIIGHQTGRMNKITEAVRNSGFTTGLTNNVMHNKRTQHQVMDVTEKTKHLFKIK